MNNLKFDLILLEQLTEICYDANNKEEVIKLLSNKMNKQGYVEPGFEKAVLERERDYPTGLPTKIPVALCHVEAEYVNQTALAIATLKKPIEFHDMGNPKNTLQVEIVFLLTIVDPKKQCLYLRIMMSIFKDNTLLELKSSKTKKEIVTILNNNFMMLRGKDQNGKKKIE